MTKGYKNPLNNRIHKKKTDWHIQTLFETLKMKSKKSYNSNLIEEHKYVIRKTWGGMEEINRKAKRTTKCFPKGMTIENIGSNWYLTQKLARENLKFRDQQQYFKVI